MVLIAVKLLLAPAFVVGASLVARHYGPRVGGLIGGLPVVAGPILLAYALVHGDRFTAAAAQGTLLGLISLSAFVLVYVRLAERFAWLVPMLAGWLAFIGCTALLDAVNVPLGLALALVWVVLALALRVFGPASQLPRRAASPPGWDLPVRALCALALVFALTAVSGMLGSRLSGLLAPFPIITTVLATFTHALHGVDATRVLLRGMLSGFFAFALFCFLIALLVLHLPLLVTFLLAAGAAICIVGAWAIAFSRRAESFIPPGLAGSA